jgi:hypothetical protein
MPDGKDFRDVQWMSHKNGKYWKLNILNFFLEHFIVWMRTAGLPNFRKLWGRLPDGIDADEY